MNAAAESPAPQRPATAIPGGTFQPGKAMLIAGPAADESLMDDEQPLSAAEVATRMAARHRDVVTLLVDELTKARDRGAKARDRLSHTLVLLDEAQAELVRVSTERDGLLKSKIDLQGELARMHAENARLADQSREFEAALNAHRVHVAAAIDDSDRNRALLHQTLRSQLAVQQQQQQHPYPHPHRDATGTTDQEVGIDRYDSIGGPGRASASPAPYAATEHGHTNNSGRLNTGGVSAAGRRLSPPPAPASAGSNWKGGSGVLPPAREAWAATTQQQQQQQPLPQHQHWNGAAVVGAAGASTPPQHRYSSYRAGAGGGYDAKPNSPMMAAASPTSPPLTMPSRPLPTYAAKADRELSRFITLSSEGHVAVATDAVGGVDSSPLLLSSNGGGVPAVRRASVIYTSLLTLKQLDVVATVRSGHHANVAVGFTSAPLDGDVASAALRCYVRGDGKVTIVCDGSEVETRLSVTEPSPQHYHAYHNGDDGVAGSFASSSSSTATTRSYAMHWDAVTRRVTFSLGSALCGSPIGLPPAFGREALCPFVLLPCPGDDVIARHR